MVCLGTEMITMDYRRKGNVMKTLFDQTEINGLKLQNRLVRSATWEGMCDEAGRPTEKLISYYGQLANGGVGLLISGYTYVSPEGKQLKGKMGLCSDDSALEMQRLTDVVHKVGGKICIQIVHAGGQTVSTIAGRTPLAPSAIETEQYPEKPEELTKVEIKRIVQDFGKAASRAKEYGFDAVQLHGAHGYLINQFLSPHTNLRSDEYGGSSERRCRFLLEVLREVRSQVGKDYPVMIKLNSCDFLEGGLDIQHGVEAAALLDKEGIDAIEVSGGTSASGDENPARMKITKVEREAYHIKQASEIKKAVSCPVMVVGGFRSLSVIDNALNDYNMDYIALSRPFIREPELPQRWQKGDTAPAACISCNSCFKPGIEEGGIYCVIEKKEREKKEKK